MSRKYVLALVFYTERRLEIQLHVRFWKDFEGQTEGQEEILQGLLEDKVK